MTSIAFSYTSLSTQPPETEPHIFPDSEMARLVPTGRGADRRVATTVATTTFSPSSRHLSTSLSISFMQSAPSCSVPPLDAGEHGRQLLETPQIMAREEPVDERQRRSHSPRERLVVRIALQRVHPHDRVRRACQPCHLAADELGILALP